MNAVLLFGLTDPWDKTLPLKKANRLAAAAVRYLDFSSKDWKELVTLINLPFGTRFALEAEMIAIHEAFSKACELTDNFDRLIIFTDCQSILEGLIKESKFSYLSTLTRQVGIRKSRMYIGREGGAREVMDLVGRWMDSKQD